MAWGDNRYGQSTVPSGLSGVRTIAAGGWHCLALKSDGTVVAWGDNRYGQSTVPNGLNDVIATAAGASHSLALRSNGTVVAWGDNGYGRCTVPNGLSKVIAISAKGGQSLALVANPVRFGSALSLGDGCFRSTVKNVLGRTVTVEVSSNLVDWTAVTNFTGATNTVHFQDPAITNSSRRFYRAVQTP